MIIVHVLKLGGKGGGGEGQGWIFSVWPLSGSSGHYFELGHLLSIVNERSHVLSKL